MESANFQRTLSKRNHESLFWFVVAIFTAIVGCSSPRPITFDIYVLIDVTEDGFQDKETYFSALNEIYRRMNIDGLRNGAKVRYQFVNDVSESKFEFETLSSDSRGWLSKAEMDRADEVKKFKNSLQAKLQGLLGKAEWRRDKSLVYQPLCRALNALRRSDMDHKIVVIFSDMLENSNLFSFYGVGRKSVVDEARKDLKAFAERIQSISGCVLPDLRDIEIHIVVWRTPENDELVNEAEKLWKGLIASRNSAIRHFSPTLQLN